MKTLLFIILIFPLVSLGQLTGSLSADVSGCQGSSTIPITFTGAGGTAPYTFSYSINGGTTQSVTTSNGNSVTVYQTTSTTGTFFYNLTQVSDYNGSTQNINDNAIANVNPIPLVTSSNMSTICSGGTVVIPITAHPAGSVFSWVANDNTYVTGESTSTQNTTVLNNTLNNTSTSVQTVVYTVYAINNGCTSAAQTVYITVNPQPSVNAVTDQFLCAGANSSTVVFSGTVSGTSYSWTNSNSSIGLPASGNGNIAVFNAINIGSSVQTATITVVPTANNCSGNTTNFTISVNPLPLIDAGPDQYICPGSSTTLNGSGGSVYSWNNGVTNGVSFTPVSTLTYTVTGTSEEGCINTDQVTVFVDCASIDENELIKVGIYPNPSNGIIYLESEENIKKVHILNTQGQVLEKVPNISDNSINLSHLPKGVYYLEILIQETRTLNRILLQ